MRTYEKISVNDKVIFENDLVHFKLDGDDDYRLGKVIFDDCWKIVDIGAKTAMIMYIAEAYGLKIYKD